MNRYTTKHFWRMKESEQGEWVRYDEYQKLIENHKAQEKFTLGLLQVEIDSKWEAQDEVEFLWLRVRVLTGVLIVNFIVFVAQLIGWSLGL